MCCYSNCFNEYTLAELCIDGDGSYYIYQQRNIREEGKKLNKDEQFQIFKNRAFDNNVYLAVTDTATSS